MSTRTLIFFVPTKNMLVKFEPEKLPKENPLESFCGDLSEAIKNLSLDERYWMGNCSDI